MEGGRGDRHWRSGSFGSSWKENVMQGGRGEGEGEGEGEGSDLHRRSSGFGSSLKCHASRNFETISFILDSDYFLYLY